MYATSTLVVAPAALGLVADAATADSFGPYSLIGTVVTPVIVVVLLLAGKLHTHGELARLVDSNEQLRAQNQTLQEALIERAVPALTRSTMVLEQITPLIQNEVRLRNTRSRAQGG